MAPRTALCCLVLLGLAGCGAEEERGLMPSSAIVTKLDITFDPDGAGGKRASRRSVQCAEPPEGGDCVFASHLRPADFEPVPDDVACTELFGGPETATVSGTLEGRRVDARFARNNGCEIARWEKVAPLLEAAA